LYKIDIAWIVIIYNKNILTLQLIFYFTAIYMLECSNG
jgi:hypothetical protein